jgi:hypothetical protein
MIRCQYLDCTTKKCWKSLTGNNLTGNGCKLVEVLSRNFTGGSEENLEQLSKHGRFPEQDSNRESLRQESREVTLSHSAQ